MAIGITKKKLTPPVKVEAETEKAPWAEEEEAGEEAEGVVVEEVSKPAAKPTQQVKPAAKPAAKAGVPSFLKKGKEAQELMAREDHKAEVSRNSIYRFFIPQNKDGSITFLDGDLVDGALDIPYFYEHNVNINGKWGNFYICTQDEEPCPICEGGLHPSYVGLMTVIDHSSYTGKDDKVHKDQIRLFAAKRDTIKQLQKLAAKRGGLAGCRFDVSRTGDKSPSVGNVFDFTEKLTMAQIVATYSKPSVGNVPSQPVAPVDYIKHLSGMYMPASELRKLGFGTASPIGSETASPEDYDDKL